MTLIFDSDREFRTCSPATHFEANVIIVRNMDDKTFAIAKNRFGWTGGSLPLEWLGDLFTNPILIEKSFKDWHPDNYKPRPELEERKIDQEL